MDVTNRRQWLRGWAPHSERGWQRLTVSGALAAAVTASGWAWAVPTAATPTAYADDMGHGGHGTGQSGVSHGSMAAGPADQMQMTNSPAASLRVALNRLLAEHVYLAARATGAALGNRQPEFEAAAAALDQSSVDLSKAIGSAYGPEAEAAFLPLWRSHIGMVVEYTQGKAANDQGMQDKAVNDLVGYTQDFGAFLSGANENLPKDTVATLVKDHVLTLKDVVDAQAAGDQPKVYYAVRTAMAHMGMIADPLAAATAAKFPDKFPGDSGAAGATLRVGLNQLLSEHVFLAASATGGALGGREAQFTSAAAELDNNSIDLAKAIGSAYGGDAEMAFLPLWRSHIGMVVDYTVGKATMDQAKQDKAVSDLLGYTTDFAAFLSGANENLPRDVVQGLVKDHALTLKDVIDAQADGDQTRQFMAIRAAGAHMQMIADPLAEATAAKFPEKFGGMAAAPSTMPAHQQRSQAASEAPAEIRQFAFRPTPLEVPVGTTVTWTNQDQIEHSVTATDGAFDSGLFTLGGTYTFTFEAPGTYAYQCARHPSMRGEVSVV